MSVTRQLPDSVAQTLHGADLRDGLLDALERALWEVFASTSTEPDAGRSVLQEALLAVTARRREIESPGEGLAGMDRLRRMRYWHERQQGVCEAVDQLLFRSFQEDPATPLERLLDQLPPRCRSLLRLRYGLDVATDPIAVKLSDRKAGIRKTTGRCLTTLARLLIEQGLAEKH